MHPGIKRSGVGSAHGILSGILAMPFPRAARERRLSNIDGGGPEKRKKENKRYLHAFLARRLDRKGRGGELRDRDEGCSRVRIDPIRAIHPSLKRNHVMVDAFSIVTNCLVKEGLYVYKDRPPPSSTFHPSHSFRACRGSPWLEAQHSSVTTNGTTDWSSIDSPSGISSVPIYLAYPP